MQTKTYMATSAVAQFSDTYSTVKVVSESPDLNSIPSHYIQPTSLDGYPGDSKSIPVIDFSHLTSNQSEQRYKAIQDLGEACKKWGFFMVVNHGIPERLIRAVIEITGEFFNMPEEEKKRFEGKHVLDPVRCGTSFNASKEKALFWRDFLKVFVHPEFHCPSHPQAFRDIMLEYCESSRNVAKKLMGAISESLNLDERAMNTALELDSMFQVFVGNYYPRCPQPELAMGLPPHSDHGLLTVLIENGVGGLQIVHEGKWVNVNALPNSLLVNTGDHLEIFSNGKYKSVVHRAAVNDRATRISVATAHGPSLETEVGPASRLVESTSSSSQGGARYGAMKYKDYLYSQQSNQLDGKTILDRLKIHRN